MDIKILYNGKAKDFPVFKYLLWIYYINPETSRFFEELIPEDFNENLN